MNPFAQPPPNSAGRRGFPSATAAKASAMQEARVDFAVLQCGPEFAWVSPLELVLARLPAALMRGINVVEIGQR